MKYLLTKSSKKNLFLLLKKEHNCNSIKELSNKIHVPIKTLQGWFYLEKRHIPKKIIDKYINKLEIISKKEDNWGQIIGGKLSYNLTLKNKGIKEIKRRQRLGGKNAAITKDNNQMKDFYVDINDPSFLEFYGILLGDGWLSNFNIKNKKTWQIGICGNLSNDEAFIKYCRSIVNKLFKRKGTLRNRPETNVIIMTFNHKFLLKYLNESLNFPIGRKNNLKIHNIIYSLNFEKIKFVIRGIFDTDGSFFLARSRNGAPSYPILNIHMNEPVLISQIGKILTDKGFRISYSDNGRLLKLSGKSQLEKWLNEIGTSNPYKLNNMIKYLEKS